MTNDKNSYFNRAHRLGRIGTIIAILFMIGIPVVVCFIYDVMPTFSEVFTTAIGLLAVYVPTALSEVISYTPMLGTACYITFITGNVGNMKIPCALNAMEMTDSPLGTERGDTVSAIAVSVSSMVTMIVIAIGVVLLVPLQPILENPTVQVATSYMLPALFGSMVVTNVANSKSGEYRIKNRILTMLAPMACIIAFDYLVMPIKGKEGYTMIVTIPLTILLAYIMYKLGIGQSGKRGLRWNLTASSRKEQNIDRTEINKEERQWIWKTRSVRSGNWLRRSVKSSPESAMKYGPCRSCTSTKPNPLPFSSRP